MTGWAGGKACTSPSGKNEMPANTLVVKDLLELQSALAWAERISMFAPLHQKALRLYDSVTGRKILTRFEELNRTQWLGRDELLALQHTKLRRLVEYAYQYVPYYRRTFEQVGFRPADLEKDPASFLKLPIVTKHDLREYADEFLTTDPLLRKALHRHTTSGSTGEPLVFWEDGNYRDHVTADILRHLTWCGWRLGEPHAYLWGQSVESHPLHQLRASLMDLTLNRFVANAYILSEQNLSALVRQIRQRHPRLIFGYASALCAFAQFVRDKQLSDIRFDAIYSGGEVLYARQRQLLEATFDCRVFDRYGTLEVGGIACECGQHAGMHISVESCCVEVLQNGAPARDDQPGEIVVTNLNNYGFPFIRYHLADVVQQRSQPCSCGRQSPMLDHVQGRVVDIFRTVDGRVVWGDLEGTVFEVEGIKQSQVIQKALDLVVIRIVKDKTFDEARLAKIERVVKKIMGEAIRVQFEFPDHIAPLESGKFRYAYSELARSHPTESLAEQADR